MKAKPTSKKRINANKKIIICIVIIVLLAVAAFYFLWPQSDNGKGRLFSYFDKNMQAEPTPSKESTVPSTNSTQPTNSANSELVVPAWGIKFSVPVALQNTKVAYTERQSNDQPPVTYYAFTTSRIQALGGQCTTQPFGDTVILNRDSNKPVAVPDGELLNDQPINGYYYTISSPIAYCSGLDNEGNTQTPSQTELNDRESLNEMTKTIQAS